jgi:hypothetical protein
MSEIEIEDKTKKTMDFIIDKNTYIVSSGKVVEMKKENYDMLIRWLIDIAYSEGYTEIDTDSDCDCDCD